MANVDTSTIPSMIQENVHEIINMAFLFFVECVGQKQLFILPTFHYRCDKNILDVQLVNDSKYKCKTKGHKERTYEIKVKSNEQGSGFGKNETCSPIFDRAWKWQVKQIHKNHTLSKL